MSGGFVGILGAAQTAYQRRPDVNVTTESLLAEAVTSAIADAGLNRRDIDGLGVASFTLSPDRVIDLAWKLGLRIRWMIEDPMGLTMVQHARRAVEAGDASHVVIVGGDRMDSSRFSAMVSQYNATTRDIVVPTGAVGPNVPFSFLTAEYRRVHGVGREAFGRVVIHQRSRAATHRNGLFTEPLTMQDYLSAPDVTSELKLFDCVPLVAGANAVVVGEVGRGRDAKARILGYASLFNGDDQDGTGLSLGLDGIAEGIWEESGRGAADVDVLCLYDDYPVIVLQQLHELGYLSEDGLTSFSHSGYGTSHPVVNPSGGLLCCGQAGAGGTLHGLVDAVEQLRGRSGGGQVEGAQTALVTNYGMVLYRYGACMAGLLIGAAR